MTDGNVMELWAEAEICQNDVLNSAVTAHLVERASRGWNPGAIPGLTEALDSQEKPFRDLVKILADKNRELSNNNRALAADKQALESMSQQKITYLEEKLRQLREDDERMFKIYINWNPLLTGCNDKFPYWHQYIIKASDKVQTVLDKINLSRPKDQNQYVIRRGAEEYLDSQKSFQHYDINYESKSKYNDSYTSTTLHVERAYTN